MVTQNTDNLNGLDTNTNRHEGQSNQELTLVVNTFLIKSLQKADKQKKLAKNSPKELTNMKKAYDAASAFTTIMNNTLDKSVPYEDFIEMNQDMLCQVNLTIEKNPTDDGDKSSSESGSSSENEAPPPKKKQELSFKSVLKTHGEESDDENQDDIDLKDTDDDEEEE
jgi:hypothetical protein